MSIGKTNDFSASERVEGPRSKKESGNLRFEGLASRVLVLQN